MRTLLRAAALVFFLGPALGLIGLLAAGEPDGDSPPVEVSRDNASPLRTASTCQTADDPPRVIVGPPPTEAERKILAALDKRGDWALDQVPLSEALTAIGAEIGVEIALDERALMDAAVDTSSPCTVARHNVSARSFLEPLLDNFDLTWIVANETLTITTTTEAEECLATKVYDLSQICPSVDADGVFVNFDAETYINSICSNVEPVSWDEQGGPGTITDYGVGGARALVISQTREVHERVEALLNELGQVHARLPAKQLVAPEANEQAWPAEQADDIKSGGAFLIRPHKRPVVEEEDPFQ